MYTNRNQQKRDTSGFVLIDALIGLTIASVLCATLISTIHQASIVSSYARDYFIASQSTLEIYEVMVALAQKDFNILTTASCPTACHVENDGSTWSVENASEVVDGRFTRSFTINTVNRNNTTGDIVETGGVVDLDTLQLDILVSWTTRGEARSENITTYLHNLN